MNNETTLLVIFVGLTAFALLVQAIVMLVAFLVMRKLIKSLTSDVQELRTKAMPILEKSRQTLDKVTPKVESVAADVAELAHIVKAQSVEFQIMASEILGRVHRQTDRVDDMFTDLLDNVEHASTVVVDSVAKPVRQMSSLLAGVKAFLTVMKTGRRPRQTEVIADQDMFV
jgi:phage-related tail protein